MRPNFLPEFSFDLILSTFFMFRGVESAKIYMRENLKNSQQTIGRCP